MKNISLTLFLPAVVTWHSYMGWFRPVGIGLKAHCLNRHPRQLKKIKILGAVLELPAKQHCQFSLFTTKIFYLDEIFCFSVQFSVGLFGLLLQNRSLKLAFFTNLVKSKKNYCKGSKLAWCQFRWLVIGSKDMYFWLICTSSNMRKTSVSTNM